MERLKGLKRKKAGHRPALRPTTDAGRWPLPLSLFTLPPFNRYRGAGAGGGALKSRRSSTRRTATLIHKMASSTQSRKAANTTQGQR